MPAARNTPYLDGPLPIVYVKTALPILLVMGMNGLLAVVDALFLGHYAGAQALAAVTLMFPAYMLVVALATLVASGMSSLLARDLGGGRVDQARAVFAGAHGLALTISAILIGLFALTGPAVTALAAGGSDQLAELGLIYLRITVLTSPLLFVMSVNADALRNEGRVGLMAALSLLVALSNILLDYLLIGWLAMGVAGAAYATALAQSLALAILVGIRWRGTPALPLGALLRHRPTAAWGRMLALGAPQSLNFIGLALGAGTIVATLQMVDSPDYASTVSAYGIINRVLTFAILPVLGLGQAMQSITGSNIGAGQVRRADHSLRIALSVALVYCALMQLGLSLFAPQIGANFVDDPKVVDAVARLLPVIVALFVLSGPLRMIGTHFQAIGDVGRAAVLGLAKPYLFVLPLTVGLAAAFGEPGIWIALPLSEALLAGLTILVLAQTARRTALRWGMFQTRGGVAA